MTRALVERDNCSLRILKCEQPQDTQHPKFGIRARQGQDEKPQPEFDLFDTSCEKDLGLCVLGSVRLGATGRVMTLAFLL